MVPGVYSKITKETFRLLTFLKHDPQDQITASLEEFPLNAAPPYTALSYTWHSPLQARQDGSHAVDWDNSQYTVLCNGQQIPVSANLQLALQCLRARPQLGEMFWIDALCINQESKEERSEQVSVMSIIFSRATSVFVWLGPDEGGVDQALELMDALCEMEEDERLSIEHHALHRPDIQQLLRGRLHSREYWQALARFFARNWFSRTWIIQEVLLARELLVICGTYDISWSKLKQVSHFLATSSWTRVFGNPTQLGIGPLEIYHNSPTKLAAATKSLNTDGEDALLVALIRSRRYYCIDPKDRVFALYGIAKYTGAHVPIPDYNSSTAQAYWETAVAVLKGSSNLLLLAYAEGECFRSEVVDGLPSWVPDWSVRDVVGLGVTGYKRFDAARDRPRVMMLDADSRLLTVEAAEIDTITAIGETKREVGAGHSFVGWLDLLLSMPEHYPLRCGHTRLEAFWRTLITNTVRAGDVDQFRMSFRSWVARTLASATSASRQEMAAQIAELRETDDKMVLPEDDEITVALQTMASGQGSLSNDDYKFETDFYHAKCLRLYRTSAGYLGLGTESVQVGDRVCIVSGCRVPLLLREKTNSKRSELVGASYVHGLMNGEALSELHLDFRLVQLE